MQHIGMHGIDWCIMTAVLLKLVWGDGRIGLLSVGQGYWLPFHITAVTTKKVLQITVDPDHMYRGLLEHCLPYVCGAVESPPLPMDQLLEPEFAALAARTSWLNHGAEVFLADLREDDPGYDGHRFAVEYRQARMTG